MWLCNGIVLCRQNKVPGLRTTFGDCISLVGWAFLFMCSFFYKNPVSVNFPRFDCKLFVASRSADHL